MHAEDPRRVEAAQRLERRIEARAVDTVNPPAVDARPEQLRPATLLRRHRGDAVATRELRAGQRPAEAVRTEARAGLVVVDPDGGGVVEQRGTKAGQLPVTDVEHL